MIPFYHSLACQIAMTTLQFPRSNCYPFRTCWQNASRYSPPACHNSASDQLDVHGGSTAGTIENTDDLYRLEHRSFENGILRLAFLRDQKTGELRAVVAYDPKNAAYFDDFDEVPVRMMPDKKILITFSTSNRYGITQIEAGIKARKVFIFWMLP